MSNAKKEISAFKFKIRFFSNTDCTNKIAQFRRSLIVLFICPAIQDFEILNMH
jgi:hypothetical protein